MKAETKKRNEDLRMRYTQLKSEGVKGEQRLKILQDEFYISRSHVIGILYSNRLKQKEGSN